MRIKFLRIHNYRSIKHVEILCGQLVVILGPNNHGKSNIVAAVDFLLSAANKPTLADFFSFRNVETDPTMWVEAEFHELSAQEKTTFKKYVSAEGTVTIRKTAGLKDGEIEVSYQGYVNEPQEWWLKSSAADSLSKRDDVEKHAETIPALKGLLEQPGKITKPRIEDFQTAYIAANAASLTLTKSLEAGPLLGVKSVASGSMPDFYLIPAVRDLSDEMKIKSTTMLGRLMQRAVQEMAARNPIYGELKTKLGDLISTLNAREGNDDRPSELAKVESNLDSELQDWGVKVVITVNPPNIEKILEDGTQLRIDDGSMTDADRKGHGLQRAVLFAMLRTWAKVVRSVKPDVTVPRKASDSLIFAIEEPELFLHPQAQRRLQKAIGDLASVAEHQIFICTHSTHFVDMNEYQNIVLVSKPVVPEGTNVKQCVTELFEGKDAKSRKDRFHMAAWINPDRGEIFFAKKVVLVEGETEGSSLPYLGTKLGIMDDEVSIVDCGSKHNLPLYLAIVNAFEIPYVVVHDQDPVPDPVPAEWLPEKVREKKRTFELNATIASAVNPKLGKVVMLEPDFEKAAGVSVTQGEKKGKALAAIDHFASVDPANLTVQVRKLLESVYGTLPEVAIAAKPGQ